MPLGKSLSFHQHLRQKQTSFRFFIVTVLLFALGDGVFSYQVPIWLGSVFHDVALVGIVMSSSSLVGFLCDLSFPTLFAKREYRFFFALTFIIALSTQLLGLLSSSWLVAILIMALWGAYYELFLFGLYHYLHTEIEPSQHASGWGITEALRSIALVTSPLIVSLFLVLRLDPFILSSFLFGVSLVISSLFFFTNKKRVTKTTGEPEKAFSFVTFRVWSTFLTKIWPVYLFYFCLIVFDATIWSVGIFFAEQLRQISPLGAFFIPAYIVPVLVAPLFAGKLARRFGKKRSAFVIAIPLSLTLFIGHWALHSPLWHVGVMVLAGCFAGLILTESEAIFEDYVTRLHRFSSEMIGLVRSASSLGYIIGPLVAGLLAEVLGIERTLAVIGLLPGMAGIFAYFKMRGKTRLPQQQLEEISAY
jgi:MFS family permease